MQSNILDRSNYFIPDLCLFGSYPDSNHIKQLLDINVKYFVDLTTEDENLPSYEKMVENYIHFPIVDRRMPSPKEIEKFKSFIDNLVEIINNNNKIYIHCRGGHGRSGVVASILYKIFYNITPNEAMTEINKLHRKRLDNMEKMGIEVGKSFTQLKKWGSPQTEAQRKFVRNYCY